MTGARPEAGLVRRLLVPSFASAGVHAVLLLAVLAATITVTGRGERRPRLAEIAAEAGPPDAPPPEPRNPPEPAPTAGGGASALRPTPSPPLSGGATRGPADLAPPAPPSAAGALVNAEPEITRAVSFAGVQAQAARRIVYVVDASGSMVNSHAFVRARLIQSINRLSPTQRFTIVLARVEPDGPGVVVMPSKERDPLVRALPSNKAAAVDWVREVVVGGRSAPLQGLEEALALEPRPDLVFLLSRGFRRTDSGGAWAGVETALAALDQLNPRSRRTGQRPVVVKTLQFLDDDPTGLMQAIGEAQGDGPGSFRVLTLEELAAADADDDTIVTSAAADASLRRARGILAEADGDALSVLYGLGSRESRARLEAAVGAARDALGPRLGAGDTIGAPIRARLDLLGAALQGDQASAQAAADALREMFVVDAQADAARRLALAAAHALAGDSAAARAVVETIEADLAPLGLPAAVRSELGVLRARFGLGDRSEVGAEWALLLAEAEVRRALETTGPSGGAFNPLLAWADDSGRQAHAWRLIAEATATLPGDAPLEPRVRFARAMGMAEAQGDEAIAILLDLAEGRSGASLERDALWEAAVLLQERDARRAADALERFANAWPEDPRSPDAVVAAIAHTRDDDANALSRRLRRGLVARPDHADADRWRLRLAGLLAPAESLVVLGAIDADSPLAPHAGDRAFEVSKSAAADQSLLRKSSDLLRSFGDARWQLVQADLVDLLIGSDPSAAADEARRLDAEVPEFASLRARAELAAGRRDEGLRTLDALVKRLAPKDELFWEAWALLLDTLAEDPAQADAVRAHLFRLRLIDPNFGAERWERSTSAVADAPGEP